LASAIDQLHQRGIIHKDIKPANALVNSATGQIWLTGFGIASRLPSERQSADPPEFIAGTLAYMAPEQTGRMNRSIDSRSDLYSLGVTLYQMITGSLPFTAIDPMEWVHCHIARQPEPPAQRAKGAPKAVSAIIMKLLAKTGEERYQTAAGVESDLQRCLAQWERGSAGASPYQIEEFPLGEHDTPDRLLIPEKLYGRAREIDTLLTSIDRVVTSGRPELVLISGYSGIGKSSVVNELHKRIVLPRGIFLCGKFEQYKRDVPYAAFAQAFQTLIRQILSKSEVEVQSWREAIRMAVGQNGQRIVNLVPEVELVIGKQPPISELPPTEAESCFHMVFRAFLGVFARKEHPLVLFLDDLQWLDAATVKLVEHLITHPDVKHLLLIGAFRDNEISSSHPLINMMETIRRTGAVVQEIVLGPLSIDDLSQLVADTLRCERARAEPLVRLVHEKTLGNPFFAIQFLTALYAEHLLEFDAREANWRWDLDNIRAEGFTDNVVELMLEKLRRFPGVTQQALKLFACLGNSADVAALAIVRGGAETDVHADLWEAVQEGIVLRRRESYRFLHDRVREAAYTLIPATQRAAVHLQIGRLLIERMTIEEIAEKIFEIVNQFNSGLVLISAEEEKDRVAELNLQAGRKAKGSTAYASACRYLSTGMDLLGEDAWERRYELTLALRLEHAECEYLNGEFDEAERLIAPLLSRDISKIDKAAAYRLKILLHIMKAQLPQAVESGLECLRLLGVEMPPHPTPEQLQAEYEKIWQALGERSIESIVYLPPMVDAEKRAAMQVLSEIRAPANNTDVNLHYLITCHMANVSLRYGTTDASTHGYAGLATILGPVFHRYIDAYRFAKLACSLVEKCGFEAYKAKAYLIMEVVALWTQPITTAIDLARLAFRAGIETGDLSFACYSCNHLVTDLLLKGCHLDEVWRESEKCLEFDRKVRFLDAADIVISQQRFIQSMRGYTSAFASFSDTEFDEETFEAQLTEDRMPSMVCCYWILKLEARFLSGEHEAANAAARKAERLLWSTEMHIQSANYYYYNALTIAALHDGVEPQKQTEGLEALRRSLDRLGEWAASCPSTFVDKYSLVSAEVARIEGRDLDAMRLYEEAIRSARENGLVQNEGIANELAAGFYSARGFETITHAYLRNARQCYLRWGANGKVRQLEKLYPYLGENLGPRPTSTIGAPVEHLDLATVIKVSQAVSAEIVLDKLIDTLMGTAIEHAGAERGLLILQRGVEQWIAAEATTGGDSIIVHLREASVAEAEVPKSIVYYVMRTRESVILDDASTQNPFSADPYICERHARSILCLPLVNQGKFIGLLYLENNLTPHVFTPTRIAVLKLLASQAAISLENTRLYRDLQEREAKIRRLVDANIMGIFIWNLEGEIIEANEAFLNMLGYSREDLVSGRVRWTDLTPAEWRESDERAVAEVKATGTRQPYEKEFFRKDGSRVPVLIGAAMFEGSRNEGVAFVLDLSEQKRAEDKRKQAEEALRASEERWSKLAENSSAGIALIALNGRFIAANLALQKMLGYTENELQGRTILEVTHGEDRADTEARLQEGYEGQRRVYHVEKRYLRKDGSILWADVSTVFVPASGSSSAFFSAVIVDHTERKQAEEALQKAQTELAHVTRVTTLGELTASIAHEVNQPLGAISNNVNACLRFLEAGTENLPEMKAALSDIVKGVERANSIIVRMRALAKKVPPAMTRLDLEELVIDALSLIHHELTRRQVTIHTELPKDLPAVLGDRIQLQQVLLNLLMNGIEAMNEVPEGERKISIRAQRHEDTDRPAVLVSVQDSGPGLKHAEMDRLFEAFYTTKANGIGMGLAISRSIIEAHGGRLWVAPAGGLGATFEFILRTEKERERAETGPAVADRQWSR
jgi:PAS domain S-box-containing protein